MSLTTVGSAHSANDGNDYQVLEATYDFSVTSQLANAVVPMITIPADSFVERVLVDVETADTGGTFDIGDGSDVDGYHDGIDATATGSTMSMLTLVEAAPNTVLGYTSGKYYSAADAIDLKVLGQTFAAAKVRVKVWLKRCS